MVNHLFSWAIFYGKLWVMTRGYFFIRLVRLGFMTATDRASIVLWRLNSGWAVSQVSIEEVANIYIYNYNDLTATSLESWLIRESSKNGLISGYWIILICQYIYIYIYTYIYIYGWGCGWASDDKDDVGDDDDAPAAIRDNI